MSSGSLQEHVVSQSDALSAFAKYRSFMGWSLYENDVARAEVTIAQGVYTTELRAENGTKTVSYFRSGNHFLDVRVEEHGVSTFDDTKPIAMPPAVKAYIASEAALILNDFNRCVVELAPYDRKLTGSMNVIRVKPAWGLPIDIWSDGASGRPLHYSVGVTRGARYDMDVNAFGFASDRFRIVTGWRRGTEIPLRVVRYALSVEEPAAIGGHGAAAELDAVHRGLSLMRRAHRVHQYLVEDETSGTLSLDA